jgi:hypothetical protein
MLAQQTPQAVPVVYRLILATTPGRIDTGASYPGCAQNNTQACIPIQFSTIDDAVNYAKSHNEIPVQVASADEAWKIIAGAQPINPSQILGRGPDMMTLLLIGGALIFVGPMLLKKFRS